MTRVHLLKEEYENLHAHALQQGNSDVSIIRNLILNMPNNIYRVDKSKDLISKAFDLNQKFLDILFVKSKRLEITSNQLIRYLIANLPKIEVQEEVKLTANIATFISEEDKTKLDKLLKEQNLKAGELFRKYYSKINTDSIFLIERDKTHTERIVMRTTEKLKNDFKVQAKYYNTKESTLLRSLINKIQTQLVEIKK